MDHVAYMKKEWGLLPKILSGEKKIESRWYKTKHLPWDKINVGDRIFFKNSGEPVTVVSKVGKVIKFESLTPKRIRKILEKYGQDDGITKDKLNYFYKLFVDKKYCLLIFLTGAEKIEPFEIDKRGFGQMAAWITVEDIDIIKREPAGAGR